MTTFFRYRLRFPAGLHVAAEGFGEESASVTVASDTLLSAVCAAAAKLYGPAGAVPLLDDGAVQLSSAFPFIRDEDFLPRPLTFFPEVPEEQYALLKRLKKVRFLSRSLFEAVLHGRVPEPEVDKLRNGLWYEDPPPEKPAHRVHLRPRVALDRVTGASQLYHVAEVYFHPEGGLFFLTRFRDDTVRRRFETALRLLADEGLGADCTLGKGLFEVDIDQVTLHLPEATDTYLFLSLYNPAPDERDRLRPGASAYALVTRRGWVSAPGGMTLRRRSTRFFAEGSVLAFEGPADPHGRLVPVLTREDAPELPYDIVRNGQALALPITLPKTAS